MGVPVTDDIVCRAKRPSVDDIFPFLFEGTIREIVCHLSRSSTWNLFWG
jgi:hypothetical protein